MKNPTFAGDSKKGEWFLQRAEKELVAAYVSKIPPWLETYHLTLMTVIWSALIILFGYLARKNLHWLWLTSIMIVLQYLSDLFDGAIGRLRNTGLIKWGYYMDHFLDYVFMCSILMGYYFIVRGNAKFLMLVNLAISGAFMVNTFLSFAATNEFMISYFRIGPTESRIFFIIVNTLLTLFGVGWMESVLPYTTLISLIGLAIVIYRTQKKIWEIDMDAKRNPPE